MRYTRLIMVLFVMLVGLGLVSLTVHMARASAAVPDGLGIDRSSGARMAQVARAQGANEFNPSEQNAVTQKTPVQDILQPRGDLHLVESGNQSLVLTLDVPEFHSKQGFAGGEPCQVLVVEGYGETEQSGWPRLPVRGAMLGIPAGGEPEVTLLEAEPTLALEHFNLCPVLTPIIEDEIKSDAGPSGISYLGQQAIRDAQAYAAEGFTPSEPVELVSTGFIRSQRVAQLRFQPFQYNPATGELRYYRRMRVRVSFPGDRHEARNPDSPPVDEGPFEGILQSSLINYEQARAWRYRPAPLASPEVTSPAQAGPAYKVLIEQDGIYELSYAYLQAAGLPVDELDPRTLKMHNQGVEAEIYMEGEADGSFDSGDYLLFYGQKMDTRYTDTNVYWLTWGGWNGNRMSSLDGAPGGTATVPAYYQTTYRLEEDHYYWQPPVVHDPDHWYWDLIFATGLPVTKAFTTELKHISDSLPNAVVRGLLLGYAATPHHHTRIYLNEHLIDDAEWAAQDEYYFEASVPHDFLVEGVNTLVVECPLDNGITQDVLLIYWFEIDYAREYVAQNDRLVFTGDDAGTWEYQVSGFSSAEIETLDITDPANPIRVLNTAISMQEGSYWLRFEHAISQLSHYIALEAEERLVPAGIALDESSNWRSTAHGADYIAITHGDFYTDIISLADYRMAQGLRTLVVDVQDVYDEFSGGVFDPHAIQDFLVYAYANWQPPAPAYVLLVGDGNYDFKGNYGWQEPNYIPPYLDDVDPWIGEVAAENRYVSVSGDDILPDMHIGRLPVKTPAETAAMVTKILDYEQNPPLDNWNNRVLFVADNADQAGDFAAYSDIIVNQYLPAGYLAQKVYYLVTHMTAVEARSAITNAINQGVLVVSYVGHAGDTKWADETLLHRDSVPGLVNGGRLPLMVPMTCLEGYFITPSKTKDYSSLGESIARAAGRGAIASWSPTGLGVASGHDYLERGLFEALFYDGVNQLGQATSQAKYYLYANTAGYRDLIHTYALFGDPASRLNVLPADVGIRKTADPQGPLHPGDKITYTLEYSNSGQTLAGHVVITDPLPAGLINPVVITSGADLAPRPGEQFVWDAVDLAPGEGGMITISAGVAPTFTGRLANQASIGTAIIDSNEGNNQSETVETIVIAPDLEIQKAGPDVTASGDTLIYQVSYANNGDDLATGVVITDILPLQMLNTLVTSSGAAITPRAGESFVWDIADLAPGEGGMITVTGTISPGFVGAIANQADIATDAVETDTGNNRAGPIYTWVKAPDLEISKQGPHTANSGTTIHYVLEYENIGNALATGVVISDVLPLEVINPIVISTGAGITPRPGEQFVWDVVDLAPGEGGMITMTGTINPGFTGVLTNQASIATDSVESDMGNNQSETVITGVEIADLEISKFGPISVESGDMVTYHLVYSNIGSADATQVVISDTLPVELVNPQVISSGAAIAPRVGERFIWDVADLAPGEGGEITVTATVHPGYVGVLMNSASIDTVSVDADHRNDSAGPVVTGVSIADLEIEKGGPTSVLAGDQITYTLSYSNLGEALATGVVISDSLPIGLFEPVVTSSGAAITSRPGETFVWDVADLAPGEGGMITLAARVDANFAGVLSNQADIATGDVEANLDNNHSGPVNTGVDIADLAIRKSGPASVEMGGTVTYRLSYSNIGTASATQVVIGDSIPAELIDPVVTSSGAQIVSRTGERFVWDVIDLAPGQGGEITITARAESMYLGTLTNIASITTASNEITLGNNTASVDVNIEPPPVWKIYLPLVSGGVSLLLSTFLPIAKK